MEACDNAKFLGAIEKSSHAIYLEVNLYKFSKHRKNIKVNSIDNRRYTMRDIGNIHKRLENVEYYTQLSLLEAAAENLQIQDADGFDRFKNGIITDNFTGHGVGEVSSNDYKNSMDVAKGELRPAFHQNNINLIESDSALENSTALLQLTKKVEKMGG